MDAVESPVIITGASGLLGGEISKYFRNKGLPICEVGMKNTKGDIISCDLSEEEQVARLPEEVSGIIHSAAFVPARENEADPFLSNRINALGTLNLLQRYIACPWILISSGSIEKDSEKYFVDLANLSNSNFYEATKMASEIYAEAFSQAFRFPLTILRCSYIYGEKMRESTILIKLIKAAVKKETLQLGEAGQRLFNFVHTSDIATACYLAFKAGHRGKYFIGSNRPMTVLDFAKEIENAMGRAISMDIKGAPPSEQLAQPHDMEKLKREIGWSPEYDIMDFIKEKLNLYAPT